MHENHNFHTYNQKIMIVIPVLDVWWTQMIIKQSNKDITQAQTE